MNGMRVFRKRATSFNKSLNESDPRDVVARYWSSQQKGYAAVERYSIRIYIYIVYCTRIRITSRIWWIRERKWKPYASVSGLETYPSRVTSTTEY